MLPENFFSQLTSLKPSFLSSGSHLQNIDLSTDQYSTHSTPNRVDFSSIVNDTLVNHSRQIPQVSYLATNKMNSYAH